MVRPRTSAALALALLTLAGCRTERVALSFRPPAGRAYHYEATVTTIITTQLAGHSPTTTREEAVLRSDQRVLDSSNGETRVRIELSRPGAAIRAYVVRFDRAAQLVDIEQEEGIPTSALNDPGLTDVFPSAAGAPPARLLRPGDSWRIDQPLRLPGASAPARLSGSGRLVALAADRGRRTGRVLSTTTLPVVIAAGQGSPGLQGTETTTLDASYDVTDGSIVDGSSKVVGRFTVELATASGNAHDVSPGKLSVEIRTRIRLL